VIPLDVHIDRLIDVGALERDPVTGRLSVHPALPSLVASHNDRLGVEVFVQSIDSDRSTS
jgi:hypothetical protein